MKNRKFGIDILLLIMFPVLFYAAVKILMLSNNSICLFKFITGHECWGCGITRAFNELFSLHFQKAYEYNPRIIIVAPLMLFIWISTLIREIKLRKST